MHKKLCRMLAVLLLMLMALPQMVWAAPSNPFIIQDNGAVTISGSAQANEQVNIIIQKNGRLYYIDTAQADAKGEYSFRTKLPVGTDYKCQVTIDRQTTTVRLNSENSNEDDPAVVEPKPIEKQYATLSIEKKTINKGYVLRPTKFEFNEGDTVWDLLKKVLDKRDISYDYSFTGQFNSVYVESIDGDGEFDHGQGSNWMYSVNGKFIQIGSSKVELEDGDTVRWRYTTNYGKDIGGNSDDLPLEDDSSSDVTVKAKTDRHGNASATVDKDTVDKAIDAAIKTAKESKNKASKKEVTLKIKADKDAKKVETTIPKNTIQKLEEKIDSVKLTTPLAELSLDKKVLATIAKQADRDVKITAKKVDISKSNQISEEIKHLIGDKPVVEFSITSGRETISQFDGKIIVTLPYTPQIDEDTRKLTVYHINDEGKAEEMLGAHYDAKCKGLVFETNHFSSFAVVYDENKAVFKDVKQGDWCYEAVNFAVTNHLFNGTTETTFSPNINMTRAMFFTVLHRMSGDTTYTGGANWYTHGMEWAKANGVSDGSNPNGQITREQLIAMLWRYQNAPKPVDCNGLSKYKDIQDVSSWALEAMQWAHETGLMRGRTETILAPKGNATRAEVATMMMRFMEPVDSNHK